MTNQLVNAPTTFATKAAANRYLATVETDIARGEWHDPRHGDLTFVEWVQRYLSVAGHKAATTRSRDETVSRVHLVPEFGPQRLAAIAPSTFSTSSTRWPLAWRRRPSARTTAYYAQS